MSIPFELSSEVSATLNLLRADLLTASYDVPSVELRLGPVAAAALQREEPVPARRGLASQNDPCATLTKLFVLGDPVAEAEVARALPELGITGAENLGLVTRTQELVHARVDLRPYSAVDARGELNWWLASDLREVATGETLAPDHVLGAGGASVTLAQVTLRDDVGSVLDLGTGCGIQALHAARHGREVVATDISQSALQYAGFNAALNGIDLDLRHGSMLDPVLGEQFDLVVSNPPFVITPRGGDGVPEYEYRDGGRAGDDVVRDLVREVGSVLAPGGVAQFLGNWEHHAGQDWQERVGGWLDDSGLDGWVIQREVLDPAEYAETWIRDGGTTRDRDPQAWDAAYAQWLADFASRDVEAVGFGFVTLRKPASGTVTMRRLEEHTGSVHQPLGAHLAETIRAHDWLEQLSDAQLLQERLVVAADVSEERFHSPGLADPNVLLLRQGGGLGRAVHASTGLAALVGACDGELPVGRLITAIAALFEVDGVALAAELLPGVRGLIRDGFLTASASASAAV